MTAQAATRKVPTYCYQCVAGPDLLTVKVQGGVATEVEPNFCAAAVHPGGGKVCVKAYGLIQKTYNPNRVLTPMKSMVRDIEQTCRDLLLQHLDPSEDSVGTRVEIDHLAASLMGMPVTLEVEISAVNKRAVTFTVTGSDGIDTICRAVHNRFVVDKAGTEQRLAEKAKKAGLA